MALVKGSERIIERKVKLPVQLDQRLLRSAGLSTASDPALRIDAARGPRFVSLAAQGQLAHGLLCGQDGPRLSDDADPETRAPCASKGPIACGVLEPLFASAKTVRIWYDDEAQTNAWEIENEVGRYFSLVSPELSRGFSGKGRPWNAWRPANGKPRCRT